MVEQGNEYLPLYESKMFHQYEHRWASVGNTDEEAVVELDRSDQFAIAAPRYWMTRKDAYTKLPENLTWIVAVRAVTNATNERTTIAAVLPPRPVGHSAQVFYSDESPTTTLCFLANLNSIALDFAARTKVGGANMSSFILRQLPILPASDFTVPAPWARDTLLRDWILPRVLELTYTAWDLEAFGKDVGYDGPPFKWDPARRFLLRAELDAAFFHLYGISRDDTDYILGTFPIVRKNDERAHGEYRTKRVILEVYDSLAEAIRTGQTYTTRLDPPPADSRVAHAPRG